MENNITVVEKIDIENGIKKEIESKICQKEEGFNFSKTPNLEDIRKLQANFSDERDWNKYHTPRNLLLALVGEVGELSEIFQWKGECSDGLEDWDQSEKTHLEEELSDVLIYLVRLADKCRVNLPEVVLKKIEMNKNKYPVGKVFGSSKKYNDTYISGCANKIK